MQWPPRCLTSTLIFFVLEDRGERAESDALGLSIHEKNDIETPTNLIETLHNFCNRYAVTIQTNTLPGSTQKRRDRTGIQNNNLGQNNDQ